MTGDKFRVKADARAKYREELKCCGWDPELAERTFLAVSLEPYRGSRTRVRVDGQPWYFDQADLAPAWETEQERAIALQLAGWEQGLSGDWTKRTVSRSIET